MDNYKVYQWMLAGGLGLKGTSLGVFALVFSYTRCGRTMFESEESLADLEVWCLLLWCQYRLRLGSSGLYEEGLHGLEPAFQH